MRFAIALLAAVLLLTACSAATPTEQTPDPDPDPGPLTVTIRDYYGANGNRTLVLVDIISNRDVTLTADALCALTRAGDPGMSYVGYEGTISVETLGSDRSLHWSNRGAPDSGANRIQCNTIKGTTVGGETVNIRLR